ncbi:MAG: hypothetical protein V1867_08435 [Candidatus Falkowbacteria bacterium]
MKEMTLPVHETPATYTFHSYFGCVLIGVPSSSATYLTWVENHILRTPAGDINVEPHWKDAAKVQTPTVLVHRNFYSITPAPKPRKIAAEVRVMHRVHPEFGEDFVLDIRPAVKGEPEYELKIGSEIPDIPIPKTNPVRYLTLKAIPPRPEHP